MENYFEKLVKSKNLHTKMEFNNNNYTELFICNNIEHLKDIILLLKNLINTNPLPDIQEYINKITSLENNNVLLLE